jgi:type II secretory pathway pseudopilin PulG
VALIVIVAVMNVLVAAALPYWSQVMKREREAELIFRGLQYAEAIRVFQLRFNRLPNTLDELIEVNPRSIRQLWKDPMTDEGEWMPVAALVNQPGSGQGRQVAGGAAPGDSEVEEDQGGANRRRAAGPVIGVRSRSQEAAARKFMGSSQYSEWKFTVELIPTPNAIPDTLLVPRPTSDWIGKPFREGLEPVLGRRPGQNLGARPQAQPRSQPQSNDDG